MKKSIIILFTIIISLNSYSGVNLKNGNFYIGFTDIILKDTLWQDLKVGRTYNSKSTYNGSFGYGWGTNFDTYLVLTPDFTVSVMMRGSGQRSIFESEFTNEENIQITIDQIIQAAKNAHKINTPEEEITFTNKLVSSLETRFLYFEKYRKAGLIPYTNHQEDITYFSQGCGCIGENKPVYNYIISTSDGYKLYNYKKNNIFYFNKQGKMTGLSSIENPDYNWQILYNKDNQLEKVTSYNGNILYFKVDSLNRIIEISSNQSDKTTKYKYNNKNLGYSRDTGFNQYKYAYDKKHNMTKCVYNPVRFKGEKEDAKHITYQTKSSYVTKVIKRDSSYIIYDYIGDGYIDNDYGTKVVTYYKDSTIKKEYSEWWYNKTNDHGINWTYKKMNITNSDTIIRVFHEVSRKPLKVITSKDTYLFTYSPKGLLLSAKALSASSGITLSYNENKDINSIKYGDLVFELIKDEAKYSKIILPNKNQGSLPIKDFNQEELLDYKNSLKYIKKLFNLSYYKIL